MTIFRRFSVLPIPCLFLLLILTGCGAKNASTENSEGPGEGATAVLEGSTGVTPAAAQALVDELNEAFAKQPADVSALFGRIHTTDPSQTQVVKDLAGMLDASTRLRHVVIGAFGEPLPGDVAPTMEISARVVSGNPPKIALADEKGDESISGLVSVEGRLLLEIDALGSQFRDQLKGPQALEISSAARRMTPAFESVIGRVEGGEIKQIADVATALQAELLNALQDPALQTPAMQTPATGSLAGPGAASTDPAAQTPASGAPETP